MFALSLFFTGQLICGHQILKVRPQLDFPVARVVKSLYMY